VPHCMIRDVNGFGVYQRRGIGNIMNEIHARRVDIDPAEVMGDDVGRSKSSDGPTRSEKALAW
jgi:hypothetical protein